MTDDFRRNADSDDGEYAPSWNPEVGDILVGVIDSYREKVGKYDSTVATVKNEDTGEDIALWISTSAMQDKFNELRPRPGERIYVRRLADGTSRATGASYRRWIVRVDREKGANAPMPSFDAEPSDAPLGTEAREQAERAAATPPASPTEPDDDLPF